MPIQAVDAGDILGYTVGDNIGIVLDSGFTWWTTIGSVDGYNLTLANPLPSSASSGNFVFVYPPSAQIVRPLKVPNARLLTYTSNNETPMVIMSRQEYMDQPSKNSPGTPTQWFYTPQRDLGYLYVWPVAQQSAWGLRFTWYRPLEIFLQPNNTMDFPEEWANPLEWLLANELRLGYSIPPARQAEVKEMAKTWYDVVDAWDRESEPIRFGLDYQYGRR